MTPPRWHEGELAVQTRAGVRSQADRVGQSIHAVLPPPVRAFLAPRRTAVLAGRDDDGRVWASLVEGPPGFLTTLDEHTLIVGALPRRDDPLATSLQSGRQVGVLVLDADGRRRMRVNGIAEVPGDGTLRVHAEQAYANCPKYIQRREIVADAAATPRPLRWTTALAASQIARIHAADTFFVASAHVEAGADASHRGGQPGFVRVLDERTLVWPDYAGNTMFQTLGNLWADAAVGLLFVGFDDGTTLQLTGRARIVWEPERVRDVPGAERLIEVVVEAVVEGEGTSGLRWRLVEASPHNPPV